MVRQNGRVTERVTLPEHFEPGMHRLQPVLASAGRLTVFEYLLSNPGSTRTQVLNAHPFSRAVVDETLAILREGGYLPPSEGRGRRQALTIDRRRVAHDLGDVMVTLLP